MTPADLSPAPRRVWRVWLERVVVTLVLGAIMVFVATHWREVRAYPWVLRWPRLAAATGCTLVAYSLFVVGWRRLLASTGGRLSLADAHRIWYFGNLARYVPGKVFQIAGTAYLARRKGVGAAQTVVASVVAQVFVIGVALALAAPTLAAFAGPGAPARAVVWSAGGVVLVVLVSPLFDRIVALAVRTVRSGAGTATTTLEDRLALVAMYTAAWAIFGLGFYLFLTGLLGAEAVSIAPVPAIGIHAAAYAGGWLALFTPGGLGVREGLYTILLAPSVSGAAAAVIAVASRLWLTACELGAAAVLAACYGWRDLSADA